MYIIVPNPLCRSRIGTGHKGGGAEGHGQGVGKDWEEETGRKALYGEGWRRTGKMKHAGRERMIIWRGRDSSMAERG